MNAHLDYVRLASWDYVAYPHTLSKIMTSWPGDYSQGKWLQYSGWRKEQFFMGSGEQQGERHAVLSASGSLAERMRSGLAKIDSWYATRVDVQMTVRRPKWLDLAQLHAQLGKDKTTLISSKENDTLYIGSRTSDKFARLYEKPLEQMYLRLEFELKGNRAKSLWRAIQLGETPASIFRHYLNTSKLPGRIKAIYVDSSTAATEMAMNAEIKHDNAKTLKWIQSLDNSFMKHLGNHEIGPQVLEIVKAWAKYGENLPEQDI